MFAKNRRASTAATRRSESGASAEGRVDCAHEDSQRPDDTTSSDRDHSGISGADELARFREIDDASPGEIEALGKRGTLAQQAGRHHEAEEAFRQILTLMPDHGQSMECLANVLALQDKHRHAAPIYEKLLKLYGPRRSCQAALCRCYLQDGRWSEASELCDQLSAADPFHAGLISMDYVARQESSKGEPMDVGSLVATMHPDSPRPYDSVDALNHDLVNEIGSRPGLTENPHDRTTRCGSQTENLMTDPSDAFGALASLIQNCVVSWVEAQTDEGGNEYLARKPQALRLSLWGTVLGENGHQESHIHQNAWVSGVYYAQLPQSIHPEDPLYSGWLELGRPPSRYPCRSTYPIERVCPREGMLVLFPSFLFHRTIPLQGDGTRISFAFDAIAS